MLNLNWNSADNGVVVWWWTANCAPPAAVVQEKSRKPFDCSIWFFVVYNVCDSSVTKGTSKAQELFFFVWIGP